MYKYTESENKQTHIILDLHFTFIRKANFNDAVTYFYVQILQAKIEATIIPQNTCD